MVVSPNVHVHVTCHCSPCFVYELLVAKEIAVPFLCGHSGCKYKLARLHSERYLAYSRKVLWDCGRVLREKWRCLLAAGSETRSSKKALLKPLDSTAKAIIACGQTAELICVYYVQYVTSGVLLLMYWWGKYISIWYNSSQAVNFVQKV